MPFNRRLFIQKLSKIGALGTLALPTWSTALAGINKTNDKIAFIAGPYLQNLMPNEVTIVWITNNNSLSWVEYGAGTYLSLKAYTARNGLIQANNRINKVTIKNLKPGSEYKYRINSKEILHFQASKVEYGQPLQSIIYSFKTPAVDEEAFKMVILNDIHDRPQTIPQLLYKHGYTGNNPDFDFVVLNGDCFDHVDSEEQVIDHLLKPCTEVFSKEVPFIFVQGNHEVRGSFARQLPDYFTYPTDKYYYSFTRGPVHFVILDSGEDKTDDNWEYNGLAAFDEYREVQQKWLEKEIESEVFKKAAFRVVLIHISPYHSGDWHGTLHCRQLFGPLFNKGKIDLMLSGHTHRYATHDADATHNYPIVIGGGPLEGKRTLIKLHATKKELNLKMIRDDGEEVGKYTIKKKFV
ncbi:hypothetical protein AAE02nite_15200 [Adhaeribacter aerolatus]|uniref:Calcineurin-like phosphoesterase domain-containing protein n=1 Tax=Adhaeribacter aerolatus TaxID=670289 RepID=A0A512AVW3_9BACT|nr:metallophosphoesterase family protein [Adhaeribacter aerolatus]GEO03856.1 hypothetical protein AAE02nite_15200 [Adhaeribacter aerolatus]